MADEAQLKILKQGVDAWNAWRFEHAVSFDQVFDFRGADLRGADLSDADLSDADFSNADLGEAHPSRRVRNHEIKEPSPTDAGPEPTHGSQLAARLPTGAHGRECLRSGRAS